MADFCSECAPKMGFEEDFNIEGIFEEVEEGYYTSVLCEGCGLAGIARENNLMKLTVYNPVQWQNKEDFFKDRGNEIN